MTDTLENKVEAVFASDGPLSKATSNYVPRPSQIEYAKAVAHALETGESLIAEAGTGTGKTFAYLVPALLHNGRVVISTAGKTLQDQLFQKDIPALLKALGAGARVALLKGRSNYLCRLRLNHAYEENVAKSREEAEHLRRIMRFSQQTVTGERGDITDVPENSGIWPDVTSTGENCLGSRCEHYEECFVMKAREKARDSDILVINHHLFLADIALKDQQVDDFLPEFDLVVIDEAHQLMNIASNFFSQTLSLYDITNLLKDVLIAAGTLGGSTVAEWNALINEVDKTMKDLLLIVQNIVKETDCQIAVNKFKDAHLLKEPIAKLADKLSELNRGLEAQKDASPEAENCFTRSEDMLIKLEYWKAIFAGSKPKTEEPVINWMTVKPKNLYFNATPLSYAQKLGEARETQGKPWVLTSATLSMNGDFSHVVEELGLEDANTGRWESPFNYAQQALLYIPDDLPLPSQSNFSDEVAAKIWPFIKANEGRAFVLCTSIRAMETIGEHLRYYVERDGLAMPILVQREKPKQELLRLFRESGNAVLVGSMSFWEGVDIKGDALSMVVIDKIPFPPPDDPVLQGKSEYLESKGENSFMKLSIPEATMHLMQGAGRLIRDHTDTGLLMVCDKRLRTARYGRKIWQSLPGFARTAQFDRALNFVTESAQYRKGRETVPVKRSDQP